MKAAVLPDRGVVKVAGEDARRLLNGLLTADVGTVAPGAARFAALLTPQGKIVADCIVAEAPPNDGGGFFLDCPRALASRLVDRLNFYKLRARAIIEDLSETLAVLAAWGGDGTTRYGLAYPDPRLPALGLRVMLPAHLADKAIAELGAERVDSESYEAHRIALGVPSGGIDFGYGDAFPHEADMDQLEGYFHSETGKEPQPEIHLRPDRRAKYDIVARVLAAAQRNHMKKIGFVNVAEFKD